MQAKQQLFNRLNNNKRARLQKATADVREELKANRTKEVPIDRGQTIQVTRVAYSDKQTEAVLRIAAHIAAIQADMHIVRNTEFYSDFMDNKLGLYFDKKLQPLFKQNNPSRISDLIMAMSKKFSDMCQKSYELSCQPEETQKRYNREMNDLLISCGINCLELDGTN